MPATPALPRVEIVLTPDGQLLCRTENASPLVAFGMMEVAKLQLARQLESGPRVIPVHGAIPGL